RGHLCFDRCLHRLRPAPRSRRSQCSRRTSTKPGGETRRRSVFGCRALRKSARPHRNTSTEYARAAKFFRPLGPFARAIRDRPPTLRRFLRSKNLGQFVRPDPVPRKRGRARVCPESIAQLPPTDRAEIADPARSNGRVALHPPCE